MGTNNVPTIKEIFKTCCDYFGIDYYMALSNSRLKEYVKVRQHTAHLAVKVYNIYYYSDVAKFLGKSQHTICKSDKSFSFFVDKDVEDYKTNIENLKMIINERYG